MQPEIETCALPTQRGKTVASGTSCIDEPARPARTASGMRSVDAAAARNLGKGSAAGTKNHVIDRIGEMIDTGADGIMLAGTPTDDLEQYRLVAEEVIPVFD